MPNLRATLALKPHAAAPPAAAIEVDVRVARPSAGVLALDYEVRGAVRALAIPPRAPSERRDELWRHSCFEAFVAPPAGGPYVEFNLSPSTAWAAYGFSGYREGMTPLDIAAPRIEVEAGPERLALAARLSLTGAPFAIEGGLRLGLSVVIEESDGRISYLALAHPAAKPDFHHQDGFIYRLEAAEGP